MSQTTEEIARDFLCKLSVDELEELVYANKLTVFPDDHIMRRFVDKVYEGFTNLPFMIAVNGLYPFIAQECYRRFISYRTALHPKF